MNTIHIQLCFKNQTFNCKEIAELVGENEKIFGFEPKRFSAFELGINNKKLQLEDFLKRLKLSHDQSMISFDSNSFTGPFMSILHPAIEIPPQTFNWGISKKNFEMIEFEGLLENENFIVGYCKDIDFDLWQNEKFINNYIFYEKEHSHLPKIYDSTFGEYLIETSKNPGRMNLVNQMWFGVTWRMYFGKRFFEMIPKERIISFPNLYKVKELGNQVIFIELFEKPEDSTLEENIEIIRRFREWIKLDELIGKLNK